MMTGFGITQEDIAFTSLQLSKPRCTSTFRRELDTGMIEEDFNVRVGVKALYENATRIQQYHRADLVDPRRAWAGKSTDVLENINPQPFAVFVPTPIEQDQRRMAQTAARTRGRFGGTRPNPYARSRGTRTRDRLAATERATDSVLRLPGV